VKEFEAILSPNGKIVFLGTPQSDMSVYNDLPSRGYDTRIWTARIPEKDKFIKYGSKLAPFIIKRSQDLPQNSPVDPDRFSDLDLKEREASYGRSGFALQFMLDTSLSDKDRYPLKLQDLIVMDIDKEIAPVKLAWAGSPEYVIEDLPSVGFTGDKYHKPMFKSEEFTNFSGSVMAIDPSGRGQDELGIAIVKMLGGNLFVPKCTGLSGGYSESNLNLIARWARDYKVNYIIVESNFGDGMFTQLLKPIVNKIYPVTIEEVRHSKQKELRIIDTLEPLLNQHRIVVSPQLIREDFDTKDPRYQLFYQLTRLTKDRGSLRNDDRLDALAIAVNYWVEQMAVDNEKTIQDFRSKELDKELTNFMENVLGRKPVGDTWLH